MVSLLDRQIDKYKQIARQMDGCIDRQIDKKTQNR